VDHIISRVPLESLLRDDFAWQEGWEYRIGWPKQLIVSPRALRRVTGHRSRSTFGLPARKILLAGYIPIAKIVF